MNRFRKMALAVATACWLSLASAVPLPAQAEQKQPQAKTKAEYDAYTAVFNEQDQKKKLELAAKFLNDFPETEFKLYIYQIQINAHAALGEAQKITEVGEKFLQEFPDAETNTKKFVFQRTMQGYQQLNNFDKTVEFAEKLLAIDPNDLPALLTLSTVLPERLPTEESQKMAQLDKAMDVTQRAQQQVNTLVNGPRPQQLTEEQWNQEKNRLLANIHGTLGFIHLNKKNYIEAAQEYEKATSQVRTNGIDFYRLGIAYYYQARNIGKELGELVTQENPDLAVKEEKEKRFGEIRDKAIDALAKSVALKGVTEQAARSELERLYKTKNGDSLEGLDTLIAQAAESLKNPVQ